MNEGAKTLLGVSGTVDFLMPLVLADLSDEQARKRSRGDAGPSIAWTVGHLLHYRCNAMKLVGHTRDNPYAARFDTTAASDGSDYPTIAALLDEWRQVGEEFRSAIGRVSEQTLDAPAAGGAHDEQGVRDKLAFFAFHEGYHLGVIGTIRKALGLPGPAERVMAARG